MSTTLHDPTKPLSSPPEKARTAPRPMSQNWLTALTLRMHFMAGIFIGPFILIAAITGTMYAFAPQISDTIHRNTIQVPASNTAVSLNKQVAAAQKEAGQSLKIASVTPATASIDTTKVVFADPSLPKGTSLGVFVNPHTGQVTGSLPVHGRGGTLPTQNWLSTFHRDLNLGKAGVWYSELAASWLGIVALGGLFLWARKQLRSKQKTVNNKTKLRRLHGWIGVATLVPLLFLAVTGVTWSDQAGPNIREVRTSMGWTGERLNTKLAPVSGPVAKAQGEHAEHGGSAEKTASGSARKVAPIDWDSAVDTARQSGLTYPALSIKPGRGPQSALSVSEEGRQWPLQRDQIAVNPATNTVTDTVRFDDQHVMAKLVTWGILFHRGELFGTFNQVLLFAVGLATIALTVMGYRMWWNRRPKTAASWQPGRMYPRGSLNRAPRWAAVIVVLAAAGIGYFLPLLGWSLLAFVVIDGALWAKAKFVDAGREVNAA